MAENTQRQGKNDNRNMGKSGTDISGTKDFPKGGQGGGSSGGNVTQYGKRGDHESRKPDIGSQNARGDRPTRPEAGRKMDKETDTKSTNEEE